MTQLEVVRAFNQPDNDFKLSKVLHVLEFLEIWWYVLLSKGQIVQETVYLFLPGLTFAT